MACEPVANCICPKTDCPHHGYCADCVAFHRDNMGDLPVCLRPLAIKK